MMNNPSKDKKSDNAENLTTKRDQEHSKLIIFQATFLENDKGKIRMTKASEATIFNKLPLIRSLFDLISNGVLKDSKDQLCYDPEHAKTDKSTLPKVSGKIVYVYNIIESKFQYRRSEYERIAKLNILTLWILMDCLHWAVELESIEFLATYLGNTEIKDKAVRSALISYMRRVLPLDPADSEDRSDQELGTLKQAKSAKVDKRKKSEIVDLTKDKVPDQVKVGEEGLSKRSLQKLNKDQLTSILKELEKESHQLPMARNAKKITQLGSFLQKPRNVSHPTPTLQESMEEMQPKYTIQKSKESNKSTYDQQNSKKPTQSNTDLHKSNKPTPPIPTARKSKKAPQPSPTKQKSKKPNQSTTTLQKLSPASTDAYIRLNERIFARSSCKDTISDEGLRIDWSTSIGLTYGCIRYWRHVKDGWEKSSRQAYIALGRSIETFQCVWEHGGEDAIMGRGRPLGTYGDVH